MYTNDELNLIILSSFEELNYKHKYILLDELKSRGPDFVKFESFLIKSIPGGVYNKVRDCYFSGEYRKKVLQELYKRGIVCVTLFSENYPEALKNIPCPPLVLFCKGNTQLLKTRCFSVVGSRRTAPNIMNATKKLAKELTAFFTVVTGMADGADSAAVDGALDSGKLISVLAYGFDYFYPAINEQLIKKTAENALLVSEYPPQTAPKSYLFPVRNRIIAGLSEGTLIVSAGKKSGALITANYALEFGREVFVFPYSLGVSSGAGCNGLIREGATLTESAEDIFREFGLEYTPPQAKKLTEEEEKLFKLISEAGEAFVPVIAEKMGKLPFQLIPLLSSLEIKGLIIRLGGNRYSTT